MIELASGFGSFASGGFSFNPSNTTTAAPLFSGFGTNTTPATGMAGGFGSTFGSTFGKPAQPPAFGATFGQPQQQQPPPLTQDEAFANSILKVSIFGDERDAVIAKWNYLQAQWGTGKSFYNQNAPPFEIPPENYLCRFKAMGYVKLPDRDNKLGYVALTFNKPIDQVK